MTNYWQQTRKSCWLYCCSYRQQFQLEKYRGNSLPHLLPESKIITVMELQLKYNCKHKMYILILRNASSTHNKRTTDFSKYFLKLRNVNPIINKNLIKAFYSSVNHTTLQWLYLAAANSNTDRMKTWALYLYMMKINTVHVKPLGTIQILVLGSCWDLTSKKPEHVYIIITFSYLPTFTIKLDVRDPKRL